MVIGRGSVIKRTAMQCMIVEKISRAYFPLLPYLRRGGYVPAGVATSL